MLDDTLLPGTTRVTQLARELCESGSEVAARQLLLSEAVALCGCAVAGFGRIMPSGELDFSWAGSAEALTSVTDVLAKTAEAAAKAALDQLSTMVSLDLAEERRWPAYAQAMVLGTPVRSAQAQPVVLAGAPLGVLVLYSELPGHFAGERCDLGGMLAEIAAIALSLHESRHKAEHLTIALRNSREIGQAIGILMAGHKVTADKAFELLRAASQHGHVKLREVAREVTLTGQLPVAVMEGSGATG